MVLRYKEEGIRSKESGSGFSGSPNNVGAEAVKRFLLRSCFISFFLMVLSLMIFAGSTLSLH